MNVIRNGLVLAGVLMASLVLGSGVTPTPAPVAPRDVLAEQIAEARARHASASPATGGADARAWLETAGRAIETGAATVAELLAHPAVGRFGPAILGAAVLGALGLVVVAGRRRRVRRARPRAARHDRAARALRLMREGETPDVVVLRARLSRDAIELLRHTTVGTPPTEAATSHAG
jgi:hypothetical protein